MYNHFVKENIREKYFETHLEVQMILGWRYVLNIESNKQLVALFVVHEKSVSVFEPLEEICG